ncbi:hypothetical protein Zmor_004406 [Zophobas morio]|uniref:Uncharacterized protein n=1 Tax=Zophobas morio TaxID=2755281 RepID=A0AA38LZE7_9CUCU|nr:hypothetical protein Zmor_004406 [Zophobas morio]
MKMYAYELKRRDFSLDLKNCARRYQHGRAKTAPATGIHLADLWKQESDWGREGGEELHGPLLRSFMLTIIIEGPQAVGGYVWTIGLGFGRVKNYFVACGVIKRVIEEF